MTGESARVVHPYSPRILQTFKEAQVAFRADPEGSWIRRDDYERLLTDHESALAESEKARKKAVQQLTETNRQLQTGLSIGGRQFYGTKEDIEWLRNESIKHQGKGLPNSQLATLLSGLEALAGELRKKEEDDEVSIGECIAYGEMADDLLALVASAGLEGKGNG